MSKAFRAVKLGFLVMSAHWEFWCRVFEFLRTARLLASSSPPPESSGSENQDNDASNNTSNSSS